MMTQETLTRLVALHDAVEENKKFEGAAPTYRDSAALREMTDLIFAMSADTAEAWEDCLPVLAYLAENYNNMSRWLPSVTCYKQLLTAYAALGGMRSLAAAEQATFEQAFFDAVAVRNRYVEDGCDDLAMIVGERLTADKTAEIIAAAQKSRRGRPKNDPIEMSEAYLAVIDAVEEKIEQNQQLHFCHEYWQLKAAYLAEHGIQWRSPAVLNPRILFD